MVETKRRDRPYSGEKMHTVVDDFIQYLCSLVIVQWILDIYNGIKYSSKNLEKTLDKVEEGFIVAYVHLLDLYNRYQQTNVNHQGKYLLESVLTFGLGIIVIMIQLNLTLLVAIITMLFNALLSGKEAFEQASRSTSKAQATARQVVTDLSEKVRQISRVSTEKVEEQANRILDEANRIAHSTMGVSPESDDTEKTPWNRFQNLSHRIIESSKNCVGGLYWMQFDAQSIVECLSTFISLADIVRKNKSWVAGKVGELRTSLDELKVSLEMEGQRLKKDPEEILMHYLQRTSSILAERLRMLEKTTGKFSSEQATNKLVTLISYIEKLSEKLVEADNVHELKDEVLKEAHDRLVDLLQWLTDHIDYNDSTHTENMESVNDE
ncbi:Mediator complex subunit 28 family protein [Acanthocheilonema viteae]